MPRFEQVTEGHVTGATEILWNLCKDAYAPINPVVLCPVCSGLAAVLKTLQKKKLHDPEEIIDGREAAGTCLVMGEILRQFTGMMANVEDLLERDKRTKLLEVDLCLGSLQSLAVTSQSKMESLVKSLSVFHPDTSTLKSNWVEFTTWLCGVLLSLYCIQKPKIWNKLVKKSEKSFNLKSFMMSPDKSKGDKSVSFIEDSDDDSHTVALKLVNTTLMEEMVSFSEHLKKVQKQLLQISRVLRESGVTHFPKPLPYSMSNSY